MKILLILSAGVLLLVVTIAVLAFAYLYFSWQKCSSKSWTIQ